MKRLSNMAIGIGSIILLLAVWSEAFAGGPFGTSAADPKICTITKVTAKFGPDGSIRYKVMGQCNEIPMTGEMAYGPNNKMKEAFYYETFRITTGATCPADPWISGAPCENQQIYVKDGDPGPLLKYGAPLSRHAIKNAQIFQDAQDNATHPNPPGPPVNARAIMRTNAKGLKATVSWLGPDQESPNGPYLHFSLEARPKNAEGAAWQKLSGMTRHANPDYRLTVMLPTSLPGTAGWELRICSTTVLARTCNNPFIPTIDVYDKRIGPALPKDPTQFDPNRSSPNALNPQPLPFKSLGKGPSTTPGSNTTLNPQPLPPKIKFFGLGSIMRRGVPEGETAPEETSPADPSAGDIPGTDTTPSEVPPVGENPAP